MSTSPRRARGRRSDCLNPASARMVLVSTRKIVRAQGAAIGQQIRITGICRAGSQAISRPGENVIVTELAKGRGLVRGALVICWTRQPDKARIKECRWIPVHARGVVGRPGQNKRSTAADWLLAAAVWLNGVAGGGYWTGERYGAAAVYSQPGFPALLNANANANLSTPRNSPFRHASPHATMRLFRPVHG